LNYQQFTIRPEKCSWAQAEWEEANRLFLSTRIFEKIKTQIKKQMYQTSVPEITII
jgi:hypothetical protein